MSLKLPVIEQTTSNDEITNIFNIIQNNMKSIPTKFELFLSNLNSKRVWRAGMPYEPLIWAVEHRKEYYKSLVEDGLIDVDVHQNESVVMYMECQRNVVKSILLSLELLNKFYNINNDISVTYSNNNEGCVYPYYNDHKITNYFDVNIIIELKIKTSWNDNPEEILKRAVNILSIINENGETKVSQPEIKNPIDIFGKYYIPACYKQEMVDL